jgi:hypothetical protein
VVLFTEDTMNRPLFEEPGPHIERADPWSGPQGFLLQGMSEIAGRLSIAQDYMEAAYVLTEAIKKGDWEDYRLANPVLFLYRHSIELFLKGVMGEDRKTHSLSYLADNFGAFIRQHYKKEVPRWIVKRLKEIAAVDPNSTTFRYGGHVGADEIYVSLPHLQDVMVTLNWALASVIGGIATERMEALARQHAMRREFCDQTS